MIEKPRPAPLDPSKASGEPRPSREEPYRLLTQDVLDYAIFMLDPNGFITSWNEGARQIKGWTAEEIIGQHFSRLYPQEAIDRGSPQHALRTAIALGHFEDAGWSLPPCVTTLPTSSASPRSRATSRRPGFGWRRCGRARNAFVS